MTDLDHVAPQALLPMSVSDAAMTMRVYQDICAAVLTPADWQTIGDREFVKRSGFQKLAVAYGLSTEIVSLTVDRDDEGIPVRAHAIVRAQHASGRGAEGDGACERSERGRRRSEKPEHDLRATATTRATNRAISNLIAFGAMSAEEVDADDATPAGTPRTLPAWTQHVEADELMGAANTMVHVVRALGVTENPAHVVRVLGTAIRSECDGGIPRCVVRVVEHLHDIAQTASSNITPPDWPSGDANATNGSEGHNQAPDPENGVSGPKNDTEN